MDMRRAFSEGGAQKLWADPGSLDEDMEKMFEEEPDKFSLVEVMENSPEVHDGRHHYDENDYQMHRGESFPHIHHPLKSMHSRSMRRRMSRNNSESDSQDIKDGKGPKLHEGSPIRTGSIDSTHPKTKTSFLGTLDEAGHDSPSTSQVAAAVSTKENEATEGQDEEMSPLLSDAPDLSSNQGIWSDADENDMIDGGTPVKGRVKFEVGPDTEDGEDEMDKEIEERHNRHRRHKHSRHQYHRKHALQEDPSWRQLSGHDTAVPETKWRVATEPEEAVLLQEGDLDGMASHRFEDVRGIRRHKIQAKNAISSFIHIGKKDGSVKQLKTMPITKKLYDRSPHEIFVELDELFTEAGEMKWKETARWIKYEEDLEEGADRWGKPHVGPLSFHSLLNLRKCLEQGTVLMDLEERELPGIAYRVVEHMVINDQIKPEDRGAVMRALLLRHRHVNEHRQFQFAGLRKNLSGYSSLLSLATEDKSKPHKSVSFSLSSAENNLHNGDSQTKFSKEKLKSDNNSSNGSHLPSPDSQVNIDMKDRDSVGSNNSQEDVRKAADASIMRKIPDGAEATTVLVGGVDFLEQPTIAFVRLAEGMVLPSLLEVPIPVRFMFVLLGPLASDLDYHEIGRSISTLMSNRTFHEAAYKADDRKDLLRAINEFLNDSIVLPPGDWHNKSLLPLAEIQKKTKQIIKRKKREKEKISIVATVPEDDRKKLPMKDDPLQRTKIPFGGLINDIKRRFPLYASDITDAFTAQCFAAVIFIYFAALSGAISFGGILSNKTHNMIGVSETLVATCLCGMLFSLFSAQPLIIIGVTGPVLLFDESLFSFCESYDMEYLPIRIWISIWLVIIGLLVVATEGSFLLRYFTRFTEDILSALISLIYIYESFVKLHSVFQEHPLQAVYCSDEVGINSSTIQNTNATDNLTTAMTTTEITTVIALILQNTTGLFNNFSTLATLTTMPTTPTLNQPNTALLTTILMFGTFFIAFFLREFRNSHYLGRTARRALGDFGVPIAICLMVALDYAVKDTYTEKLSVPEGLSPSDPDIRGWFISPLGLHKRIPVWQIFAASLPALLFFILLFMEVQICELIVGKKERKLVKGSGFHLDILLMCLLNLLSSFIGGPWMSAAIVRAIAHIMSLTVMSRTHAPGDKPQILMVYDQRISNFMVSLLVGVSVSMTVLLRLIPVAVLFGIFLYMGIVSMTGVQFFERLHLFFMPVKHYPQVAYVKKVRTWKMHLFTAIQLLCFAILWAVKSSIAAIALPFVLVLMIPVRGQLKLFFSEQELKNLDNAKPDAKDDEDEPDFYEEAPIPG